MTTVRDDLLDRILARQLSAFALFYRPESGPGGKIDVLAAEMMFPRSLSAIPLPENTPVASGPALDQIVVVPYRQITERGFTVPDDGAPLVAMRVTQQDAVSLADALTRIPDRMTRLINSRFDMDDSAYAETVRRVVLNEIGAGEGANFVIKRSFLAEISDYSVINALSFFRRLLEQEQGAYWTFLIHTGAHTLVGATPELHITVRDGMAVMNPISGTYRYPPAGPTLHGVTRFLANEKEIDELYMVLDEELKMMARICDSGGRVRGPYLKEMSRLAHTEYFIDGQTRLDVREVLRETMFAPTVTGSPLESAIRVITRYEPAGRRYYGGIAALIGRDDKGQQTLDSAILIRTADIDAAGRVQIPVGATLVRHSDPVAEAAETRVKAAGLLQALETDSEKNFRNHPAVRAALQRRNAGIAQFWQRGGGPGRLGRPQLAGVTALVIDAEDSFTAMLGHQLHSLGLRVTIRRFDDAYAPGQHDLVIMGPGPGDPRDSRDPKMSRLRSIIDCLLAVRQPFLAVCLSHQVLSQRLGFRLYRRKVPNQGVQRDIDQFGTAERVGFYNTFAAHSSEDKRNVEGIGIIEVSRNPETLEVHALRGPFFASLQFHAESVLTVDGPRIIAELIRGVLSK